jgi:pimeloyl-ACP methyl ester carboxylesterase
MKKQVTKRIITFLLLLSAMSGFTSKTLAQPPSGIKNVLLVHGAFSDRSGWEPVYKLLTAKGYHAIAVQIPLTSLQDDVDAVKHALDKMDGPTIVIGHSWSGTVITQAGDHPNVAALVYVAAFQPDAGENTAQWLQSAPIAPECGLLQPDDKGLVYYDKAKFHEGFCADLTQAQADWMADSQQPIVASSFGTKLTVAAWKTKPAYAIITMEDKNLNPIMQHAMFKRSGTPYKEIKSSHSVFLSHPKEVADYIMACAEKGGTK